MQIVPLDMGWEAHHFVDEELGPQQATTAELPPTPLTALTLTRSIPELGKNVVTGYAYAAQLDLTIRQSSSRQCDLLGTRLLH